MQENKRITIKHLDEKILLKFLKTLMIKNHTVLYFSKKHINSDKAFMFPHFMDIFVKFFKPILTQAEFEKETVSSQRGYRGILKQLKLVFGDKIVIEIDSKNTFYPLQEFALRGSLFDKVFQKCTLTPEDLYIKNYDGACNDLNDLICSDFNGNRLCGFSPLNIFITNSGFELKDKIIDIYHLTSRYSIYCVLKKLDDEPFDDRSKGLIEKIKDMEYESTKDKCHQVMKNYVDNLTKIFKDRGVDISIKYDIIDKQICVKFNINHISL